MSNKDIKDTKKFISGSDVRARFLEYFTRRGHEVVHSSSLVPHDDPTLLFTNAGMNQFKDIFLGNITKPYTRATSCQKVVRAGGKHNDLDNVGVTSRHHTFFEMLGNFSFGDYFKEDAIKFAWDFLTRELELPVDKLFVSVFEDDDEAFEIWRDVIGLPESKILRMGEEDNFWQMGDTGPCGPCSEIHIDQGEGAGCGSADCSPYCSCDRHLELWNLVFMQYNRDEDGNLNPLPKPSIDTGMGLERIVSIVQGVQSNYDTDLFTPIIDFIAKIAKVKYKGQGNDVDTALRVIADHSRSATFLISDGVLPSNEGRGYVLRRIMRRAMRYLHFLNVEEAAFYKVCIFVIDFMKNHYVELLDKKAFVEKIVHSEEDAFSRTLSTGIKMIQEEIFNKLKPGSMIPGDTMFKLYDTYGFPVDLLQDIVEDKGYTLDLKGFSEYMAVQQEMAKRAGLGSSARGVSEMLLKLSSGVDTSFGGYCGLESASKVIYLIQNEREATSASEGAVDIVTDSTIFYPEGGGQAGDKGTVETDSAKIKVVDTIKIGGMIVLRGEIVSGVINKDDKVTLKVDGKLRGATTRNHTATHLLQKALQLVLGDHVRQAGSYVGPEMLRFDFTHYSQLTDDELRKASDIVNDTVSDNVALEEATMAQEEAIRSGAMALFGEKYDDEVRVVSVGGYSRELCGGTHVGRTSEIGAFVIISESSIASGVRRIEALTGLNAMRYLRERDSIVKELAGTLKTTSSDLASKIASLQSEVRRLEREVAKLRGDDAVSKALDLFKSAKNINGISVVTAKFIGISNDDLRKVVDEGIVYLKEKGIVLAATVVDEKVSFVCKLTPDIVGAYKAGDIIKQVAAVAGGSGGGRPDMAQAGGKDVTKVDEALELIYKLV